ncbi:MAG TPA: zf-HC2 domain-containing protein [Pyrinomonadaceae bacterium]
MKRNSEQLCSQNLIPAYIDGELDDAAQSVFEAHLDLCSECRDELRIHQQFICALDSAFTNDAEVSVPADFSRIVAARAVSDMSGVRSAAENKKALLICLILACTGFGLIGATTRQMSVGLIRSVFAKVTGVLEFLWHTIYDSVASVAIISRVVSRRLVVETGNVVLVFALFALALLVLSRLISNYHRTGAIE